MTNPNTTWTVILLAWAVATIGALSVSMVLGSAVFLLCAALIAIFGGKV